MTKITSGTVIINIALVSAGRLFSEVLYPFVLTFGGVVRVNSAAAFTVAIHIDVIECAKTGNAAVQTKATLGARGDCPFVTGSAFTGLTAVIAEAILGTSGRGEVVITLG